MLWAPEDWGAHMRYNVGWTSRNLLLSWFFHMPRKLRLHGRPLAGNNAVDASIAECSVVRYLMAAQYTVQLCPQPLYPAAALIIKKMGPKFHRNAQKRLKRVLEH